MVKPRRDPEIVRQMTEAATEHRTQGRLLREIRALQGEIEHATQKPREAENQQSWGSSRR